MIDEKKTVKKEDESPRKGDGLGSDFHFTILPDELQDDERLGRRELGVYWAIARHSDKHGRGAFPSIARLARLARYSRQAVIDATQILVCTGWIDKQKRIKADGATTSNFYFVYKASRTGRYSSKGEGSLPAEGRVVQPTPLPPSTGLTETIPSELEPSNKSSRPSAGAEKKGMIPGFRHCTDHFFELFRAHFKGTKSPGWGAKETGLIKKDLARVQGDDRYLRVAMEVFFDGDHRKTQDFAADAGYEYGVFHGCLGGMLEYMRREELHGRADW